MVEPANLRRDRSASTLPLILDLWLLDVNRAYLCRFVCGRLSGSHASDSRDPHGRPIVPPYRSRHAAHRRTRALRCAAYAFHRNACRHLHGASHIHDRRTAARSRHCRERPVPGLMEVWLWRQSNRWSRARRSGRRDSAVIPHCRQSVLVVQRRRRTTSASRRGRSSV